MKHLGGFQLTRKSSRQTLEIGHPKFYHAQQYLKLLLQIYRACFISSMRQEKYVTDLSPLFLLAMALRTRHTTLLQRLLRLDKSPHGVKKET